MFASWARGAEASTPPVRDAFQDVFANHLLARLNARNSAPGGTNRSLSRLGSTRKADTRWQPDNGRAAVCSQPRKEETARTASSSEEPRRISADRGKRLQELHKAQRRPKSQAAAAGLAADQNQPAAQSPQNQSGATAANPPQALQDLITFLQSFPGGSLKISPEQAPAVASYLKTAGLPQQEIDRLLSPSGNQEISLNAADLQAAWQRVAEQGTASAGAPGQSTTPASTEANQPQVAANQPQATQTQETPKIQETPGYRALWERLTLPQNILPTLRQALSRLGAPPQVLAQLEGKDQGQGVPLTRVWQVLQEVKDSLTPSSASDPSGAATGADLAQSDVLGARPVTGAEMEEWRQVLLKAGLQPEVVEKLLGQKSPGTQEELKTTLLAAAPAEEAPHTLAEPKPLYQPQSLQMRPFFWQSRNGGGQPQLNGDGSEAKGQNPTAQLANLSPASTTGENFALSTFPAELQGVTQGATGAAAPLSDTGSTWRLLPPEVREALWTQLQSGVTTNLSQGENRVTLNLNPPELGQIQLTLNLRGQELAVTALATRPEVSELASLGMPQLVQALAQQGLVLTDFQVRLQDQPQRPVAPVLAGARDKGSEPGGNSSTPSRRRTGEVDRFV